MRGLPVIAAGLLCVAAAAQQIQPQPLSVGIVLDTSGSMGAKMQYVRQSMEQFLQAARAQDEFLLVYAADRPLLTSGFTASTDEIQDRVRFMQSKGRSALFDAAYLALWEMRRARNPHKALLVISDGGDNGSRYAQAEIENAARDAGVKIYTIGILESAGVRERSREEVLGPDVLSRLAERTGGRSLIVDTNLTADAGARVAAEMRASVQ